VLLASDKTAPFLLSLLPSKSSLSFGIGDPLSNTGRGSCTWLRVDDEFATDGLPWRVLVREICA